MSVKILSFDKPPNSHQLTGEQVHSRNLYLYKTHPAHLTTPEHYNNPTLLPIVRYSGAQEEWYWGDYPWTQAKENDLKSFMLHLRNQTDEEVAWFLNNPEYELIQKKWNILIDYYKKEFGIDLRKMGNTTF